MNLNLEVNGKTIMQAENVTSYDGKNIWYNHKMLCCLSPEENGTTKISICHLENNSQKRTEMEKIFGVSRDDYGMNLENDVLTETERAELEAESEAENAKR